MKKNNIILLLLFLFLTIMVHSAVAQGTGDFTIEVLADGTAEITLYQGTGTDVTIPQEIDGMKVTSVGSGAFSYNETIKSVVVPDGVVSVGDHAFGECTGLESVSLPESLTWLGEFAFQGDVSLKSVSLPGGLVHIGSNPFDRCDVLEAVELRPDHPFYKVEDGILFDLRTGQLMAYPAGKTDLSYTVPDWVTSIGLAGFSENPHIQEITLPDSLTEVNGNPFCGCTALKDLHISENNLHYAVIDHSLYNIQTLELIAYLWGNDKKSYSVRSGTSAIGQEAFYKHSELTSVTLPDSVSSIGIAAFAQTGIVSMRIPKNVRMLSNSLFSECGALVSVILPEGLTVIDSSAFYMCTALRSVNLPDSLLSIGYAAFLRCDSLRGVTIPEGVKVIGDYAYAGCAGLAMISLPKSLTSIGENSFYSDPFLILSVPGGSYAETWAEEHKMHYRLEKINYKDSESI